MNLYTKPGIAGAVAREILSGCPEGLGYKIAWDKRGSDFLKHCETAWADDAIVSLRTKHREWVRAVPHA